MMIQNIPKVTIAIPTYNRPEYLRKAVASALNQTYKNVEIVISDNNSAQGIPIEVKSIEDERLVRIIQTHNLGQAGNWNACVQLSTGSFFLMLSDDDLLLPFALERLMEPFLGPDSENYGISYGRSRIIDEKGCPLRLSSTAPREESARNLILKFWKGERENYPCSILLRTRDLRLVGQYDGDRYGVAMDAAAWMKILLLRRKAYFCKECVAEYRIHSNNLTSSTTLSHWMSGLRVMVSDLRSELLKGCSWVSKCQVVFDGDRFLARMALRFAFSRAKAGRGVKEKIVLLCDVFHYISIFSSMTEIMSMSFKRLLRSLKSRIA